MLRCLVPHAVALCLCLASPCARASDLTLFVSPTGSGSADGSSPASALNSIDGLMQRLRALRNISASTPDRITVNFAPGTYTLSSPWTITSADLPSPAVPILFQRDPSAPADAPPVLFSGGTQLAPWRLDHFGSLPLVWSAPLPDDFVSPGPIRDLWVGSHRAVWARSPNDGEFLRIDSLPADEPSGDWTKGQRSFLFTPADSDLWRTIDPGAEVTTFVRWIDSHLRVASVDSAARTVRFATRNVSALGPGDLYCIQGDPDLLDAPGEFFADLSSRRIYYIPTADEVSLDPASVPRGVIPRLASLLTITGDPSSPDRLVSSLAFRHLSFAHSRWWFDDLPAAPSIWQADSIGFAQAAAGVPGAVRLEGVIDIRFEHCELAHVASYGVEFARGCSDSALTHCTIHDLGAGGVKIGETVIRDTEAERTGRITIEDCSITDGGHHHHQAVGLWIGQSAGNSIRHNRIAEFDYTGISVGWTWGYGPALAGGNLIEFNEISSLGARPGNSQPPLGDMGGIYTLGAQPGTIIRNNFFHDIAGRTIAWGIYFDEGSAGILAQDNIVLRTTHGGFHQHYGRDNTLRNNIFAFGRDAQLWRTRREEHHSFTFDHNIVVYETGVLHNGNWTDNFSSASNLYFRINAQPISFFGNVDLPTWQSQGHDADSLVADPLFVNNNPETGRFLPGSPALTLGIRPIDISTVGPRR